MPDLAINLSKLGLIKLFARILAACWLDFTKGRHMIPVSTFSFMQWRSISMRLVLSCWTELWAILIAAFYHRTSLVASLLTFFGLPKLYRSIKVHKFLEPLLWTRLQHYSGQQCLFLTTPCNQISLNIGTMSSSGFLSITDYALSASVKIKTTLSLVWARLLVTQNLPDYW